MTASPLSGVGGPFQESLFTVLSTTTTLAATASDDFFLLRRLFEGLPPALEGVADGGVVELSFR